MDRTIPIHVHGGDNLATIELSRPGNGADRFVKWSRQMGKVRNVGRRTLSISSGQGRRGQARTAHQGQTGSRAGRESTAGRRVEAS